VKVTNKVSKTEPEALVMPTTLVGQNGAVVNEDIRVGVSGCPKVVVHMAVKTGKKGKGKRKK
jgi:hypothetical protein